MSSIRKKQEEKNLKILRELLTFECNKYCFDCNQRGPTYVNITIGSFVCTNCSGALRKYTHRLKSMSMSNFSQAEMDFIKKRGNNICKRIYYGLCENNVPPEMDIKNGLLDSHLRAKYELKKWYVEPSSELEEETIIQNQVYFDRVEKGVPKPVKSYSVNSSSNIIIEPPRLSTNKVLATIGSKTSIDLIENLSPFSSTSQHKSSTEINKIVDPSKLAGGSAVRLPMPTDQKVNNRTAAATDLKTNQNTQSLFGDDFFFSKETASEFSQISKSHTMDFNMHPLVPVQQTTLSSNTQAGQVHYDNMKGSDKYAALAELDDLFSNTSVAKQPASATFSSPWDSVAPVDNDSWYGASMNHFSPTSYQATPSFNPFASVTQQTHWPDSASSASHVPANPFLGSATVHSKNPFL